MMNPPKAVVEGLRRSKYANLPEREAIRRLYASLLEYTEFRAEELRSGCPERHSDEKTSIVLTYKELLAIHDHHSSTPWDAKSSLLHVS
jgi:hypothetical protein